MHLFTLFTLFFQLLLVSALPGGHHFAPTVTAVATTGISNYTGYGNHTSYATVYNSTITVSVTQTSTTSISVVTTISPVWNTSIRSTTSVESSSTTGTSSTSPSTSEPTLPFAAIAIRPGSPIHLLPINAARQRFWLGGHPSAYCPPTVEELGACPDGDVTAFGICAMAVLTPGGQEIYARSNGEIGYTRAHSIYIPPGSSVCPFSYTPVAQTQLGHLSANATNAFGANGLQACPNDDGQWQVLLNLANATVPHTNQSVGCLEFSALAVEYTEGYAAWQYE